MLSFRDAHGRALHIAANYPQGGAETYRVDEAHPVAAGFSYQVTDPGTGDSLTGPTPTSVEVAFPGPVGAYSVAVPWTGGDVPGPVDVNNAGPTQG